MLSDRDKKLYERLDLELPEHIPHGTEKEIEDEFKIEKVTHNWVQDGNRLICRCELGKHVSFIPTNYILNGTDENGNPLLTKLEL